MDSCAKPAEKYTKKCDAPTKFSVVLLIKPNIILLDVLFAIASFNLKVPNT